MNSILMNCGGQVVKNDNSDNEATGGQFGYGYNGTLTFAQCWTTSSSVYSTVNPFANPSAAYQAQVSGKLSQIKDTVFYGNNGTNAYTEATTQGVFATGNNNVQATQLPIQGITRGATQVLPELDAWTATLATTDELGRLRALAITSPKRWNGMPDLPTTGEIIPGFVYEAAWHGIFAPAKTPRALLLRWQSEVAKAIRVPKMRELLENGGYVPVGDMPEEFRKFLEGELKQGREYMRIAKVQPE